jgi:hypothetical protein
VAVIPPLVRYVWAAPTTAVGLAIVVAGRRGAEIRVVDGVLEAHGPALAWLLSRSPFTPGGAWAMTLGHVVIGQHRCALERTRVHERVHVRQAERWGPLFLPAYLSASLWAVLRGRHAYFENRFEREAFRIEQEQR